jgi:hypothetical protein
METREIPGIPILLREARGAYGAQIRSYIADANFPPLPLNGALILGGLHEGVVPFDQLVHQRRKSIERYRTIEQLFADGYLEGEAGSPILSPKGHEAAHIMFEAVSDLTESLEGELGVEGMQSFLRGMLFLIETKESIEDEQHSTSTD